MIIIALEGLDKSGKATQTSLLASRLRKDGYSVAQSEFHRYDTPTGELIMKWLKKEWNVDQKTIEFVMAADKQAQQSMFTWAEESGIDALILDRYTLSQLVYSTANGIPLEWAEQLQKYMRQPDLTIVIDIPAEVSMLRKGKHNDGVNDRYESDLELLREVKSRYWMLRPFSSIVIDGERSVEAIHEDIYSEVKKNLESNS